MRAAGDLNKHECPGRYQRFYFGKVKKGRKTVEGIVYLDEYVQCTCLCHIPEDERPKKRTRKTAKKAVSRNRRRKPK